MSDWKSYLSLIYFNPKSPASYAGPGKLYRYVKSDGKFKIGMHRIRKWLQDQESYSLTRGARRKYDRSRVIVEGIDSQWDMDLIDMVDLADKNDGYKYLLVAIDIFSRFAFCQAMKRKKAIDVVKALRAILSGSRKPNTVRSDKGQEFRSKDVNKYFDQMGIHHFYAQNTEIKANYIERFIKTLKHKIFRYILQKRNQRYVNVLQDLMSSYNNTTHSSLNATPSSINKVNESESRLQQYLIRTKSHKPKNEPRSKKKTTRRFKLKLGQTVRMSHVRNIFDREYSQKWTGEIFKITTRFKRDDLPVYKVEDWDGEPIDGTFYQQELQAITVDENTEYHVEKILQKRTRKKQRQVLVRWLHWPKKYDSWIPEDDVKSYQ
ncbi:uncharacterized protein LOC132717822 [Ruditapes philippinarum]|uniref:uncharacterized protein LOC132717822 n=1 Tax=Ruditapes philippinarum TaxID=129788 RepID=UPI00295BF506|nr:uncharacterized protein LOC132717822 [Ruditapes philippinarum]